MSCPLYRAVVACVLMLSLSSVTNAAPFVNLNFEQAMVPPGTPPGTLPASLAFPGWTPQIGQTVVSSVYYNHVGAGEGVVALYDHPLFSGNMPVSEGSYSSFLYTDVAFGFRASLSQLGDVPATARSVRFLVPSILSPPQVFVNGARMPVVQLSPTTPTLDPMLWGIDITSFAGMTIDLRFSSGTFPLDPERITGVDAIAFSTQPIPEPHLAVALGCAGLVGVARRRMMAATN